MPQLQSLLSFISLYAENKDVCTHLNELQNSIYIIPKLSETSPSKHWWCRGSTAYRNVNFNVFTSLLKRLKKNRAWYCWDFEKASLKDLDRLMTSSKHPSPSDPVIPARGGKFGSPYCVCVFSQHLPHPCGPWLWVSYPPFPALTPEVAGERTASQWNLGWATLAGTSKTLCNCCPFTKYYLY